MANGTSSLLVNSGLAGAFAGVSDSLGIALQQREQNRQFMFNMKRLALDTEKLSEAMRENQRTQQRFEQNLNFQLKQQKSGFEHDRGMTKLRDTLAQSRQDKQNKFTVGLNDIQHGQRLQLQTLADASATERTRIQEQADLINARTRKEELELEQTDFIAKEMHEFVNNFANSADFEKHGVNRHNLESFDKEAGALGRDGLHDKLYNDYVNSMRVRGFKKFIPDQESFDAVLLGTVNREDRLVELGNNKLAQQIPAEATRQVVEAGQRATSFVTRGGSADVPITIAENGEWGLSRTPTGDSIRNLLGEVKSLSESGTGGEYSMAARAAWKRATGRDGMSPDEALTLDIWLEQIGAQPVYSNSNDQHRKDMNRMIDSGTELLSPRGSDVKIEDGVPLGQSRSPESRGPVPDAQELKIRSMEREIDVRINRLGKHMQNFEANLKMKEFRLASRDVEELSKDIEWMGDQKLRFQGIGATSKYNEVLAAMKATHNKMNHELASGSVFVAVPGAGTEGKL